jgi:hypothetical protein
LYNITHLDLSQLDKTRAVLGQRHGDELSSLGVTFSSDDISNLLLLRSLDEETSPLGLLLGDLLELNSLDK